MRVPRLLDLYCKEGGATRGYQIAGFRVTGVDFKPQPRYCGDEFIQADALDVLADLDYLRSFDVRVGSPPCQAHSALAASNPHTYVDLIPQTRAAFRASGGPYVIENVVGAPLHHPTLLCGSMFGLGAGGYRLERHRLFESNVRIPAPPCRHDARPVIGVYGNKARSRRRGNGLPRMGTNLPKHLGEQAMGIDWMTINGLSEAIPPAYTRFIGAHLIRHIEGGGDARPGETGLVVPYNVQLGFDDVLRMI